MASGRKRFRCGTTWDKSFSPSADGSRKTLAVRISCQRTRFSFFYHHIPVSTLKKLTTALITVGSTSSDCWRSMVWSVIVHCTLYSTEYVW